jgi:enamine deaminase RidA (YjgF/YER057c/UK114 family)
MPIRRLQSEGRLSGAVIHGNLVYLAGQVADDPSLETEGQTADVLRQIDALLAGAGTDKSRCCPARYSSPTWRTWQR